VHSEMHELANDLLARAGLTGVKRAVVVAAAVLAAVVIAYSLVRSGTAPPVEFVSAESEMAEAEDPAQAESVPAVTVVIHVAGAVSAPGVYELPDGARVNDALKAAGGALGSAAVDTLNLARILTDGEQVYVPTQDEIAEGAAGPGMSAAAAPSSGAAGVVNLNTASVAELDALPGIGPSTAQKIVDDRAANGPFGTVDDLMRVSGIGAAKLDSLREYVTVK